MSEFKNKLKKTAALAAIKLTTQEELNYVDDIKKILTLLEGFQDVNTDNINPLKSVNNNSLILRKDVKEDPQSYDKVMQSSQHAKYGYFVTPKFVD